MLDVKLIFVCIAVCVMVQFLKQVILFLKKVIFVNFFHLKYNDRSQKHLALKPFDSL